MHIEHKMGNTSDVLNSSSSEFYRISWRLYL